MTRLEDIITVLRILSQHYADVPTYATILSLNRTIYYTFPSMICSIRPKDFLTMIERKDFILGNMSARSIRAPCPDGEYICNLISSPQNILYTTDIINNIYLRPALITRLKDIVQDEEKEWWSVLSPLIRSELVNAGAWSISLLYEENILSPQNLFSARWDCFQTLCSYLVTKRIQLKEIQIVELINKYPSIISTMQWIYPQTKHFSQDIPLWPWKIVHFQYADITLSPRTLDDVWILGLYLFYSKDMGKFANLSLNLKIWIFRSWIGYGLFDHHDELERYLCLLSEVNNWRMKIIVFERCMIGKIGTNKLIECLKENKIEFIIKRNVVPFVCRSSGK